MKNNKIVVLINILMFISITLTIAVLAYEGADKNWYPIVKYFIATSDLLFIISTIINLIFCRKSKWLYVHIVSFIFIVLAIVLKVLSIKYSPLSIVTWDFYIWFLYGIQNIKYFSKK